MRHRLHRSTTPLGRVHDIVHDDLESRLLNFCDVFMVIEWLFDGRGVGGCTLAYVFFGKS